MNRFCSFFFFVAACAEPVVLVREPSPPHETASVQPYEDPTVKAWKPTQALFDAAFAAERAEYDAMQPLTLGNANRASELRERFVRRCIAESDWSSEACWNGTFARDITEALALVYIEARQFTEGALEMATYTWGCDLRDTWRRAQVAIGGKSCESFGETSEPSPSNAYRGGKALAFQQAREPNLWDLQDADNTDLVELRKVEWKNGASVAAMTRSADRVTFTLRTAPATTKNERACDRPEWRRDASGNEVLTKPCETVTETTPARVFPRVIVPSSDVGDYRPSPSTEMWLVFPLHDKAEAQGRVLATYAVHGDARKMVLFRGLLWKEAKPGHP